MSGAEPPGAPPFEPPEPPAEQARPESDEGAGRESSRRRGPNLVSAVVWFGGSYGGAVAGYVLVNAVASRLLQERFGYFVIAVSVSMVVGQLGLFGVHRGGLREAARLGPEDEAGLADLRHSVRAVSLVTLPLTSLAAAGLAVVVSGDQPDRWPLGAMVGLLVWFSGQQKLWANYLRGLGQVRLSGLVEGRSGGALVAVSQAAAIAVLWWLLPDAGLVGALAAMTVGFAVPVMLAWLAVWRTWRHVPVEPLTPRSLRVVISRYRHFAYTMMAGSLNSQLELWLAGALLSSLDASLFSAANRISMLLPIFIMSLGVVYSPLVSRLYEKEQPTLERLVRTGATFAALMTAVLWVPILVAPGLVLGTVFGATFTDAAPILVILTLGAISNVVTGLCQVVLNMTDQEAVVARVQWLSVVVRLALGLLLGSVAGATGLAVSASLVTVVTWVLLWYLAIRRTGLRTHPTLRPEPRLMLRARA